MIEILAGFLFVCIMYFMYGLGVVHGQKHEEKRQKIRQSEIDRIGRNRKPTRRTYAFGRSDGYEIFHANLN